VVSTVHDCFVDLFFYAGVLSKTVACKCMSKKKQNLIKEFQMILCLYFLMKLSPNFSLNIFMLVKGVVNFFFLKTFADNLLTPMSSKMSMSFYLQSKRNYVF